MAWLVPPLVTLALLGVLLPLGVSSILGAMAGLALTIVLILLATFGIERTAIVLLFVGFLTAPMNNVKPVAALSFITVSDVFFALGVGTLIPILMFRRVRAEAPFLLAAGGLFAAGLLSSSLAVSASASVNGLARLVVGALFLPIVFMLWRPGRNVLIAFATAYVIGNCISVVQGLASGVRSVTEGRYIGLTEHPNILGLVSMFAVGLTPFLWFTLPRQFRWMILIAAATCGYGIWISGSRAALVGVVVVVVLYLLISRSIEHTVLVFGLSIIPFYFVASAFASGIDDSSPLGRLRGGGSATLSDVDRENLARTALDKFTSHPVFGTGFADAAVAHNIYLQVAAAGGLVAIVFYLGVLFTTIRQPLTLEPPFQILAVAGMAYALCGPLTPLIWDRYIWCVLALPFLMPRPPRPEPEQGTPVRTGAFEPVPHAR